MKISNIPVFFLLLSLAAGWQSCGNKGGDTAASATPARERKYPQLFEQMAPAATGITFQNVIAEDVDYNILNFEYLYNGGGIGIGDINNDGLQDVYCVSINGTNKLYLNKGNFKFEDITDKAGVAAAEGVKTGVAMVDVNADGYIDIYVCRTGRDSLARTNHLFINNKNLTFTDRSKEYGLDDKCPSNHANFFDYDKDGDLDLYLLNHPLDFASVNQARVKREPDGRIVRLTQPDDEYESDRFYRNNGNGTFTNVSKEAGIVNRAFGLSCTVTDFNNDGWPDIYIGNDYNEPDILYINNKNGTFTDRITDYFRHTSMNTMGADIADLNNDGLPDLVAMDMNAEDNYRQKLLNTPMKIERYTTLVNYGFGKQQMRNVLQLNNGVDKFFSDVSCMAGTSNTDWSWSPLLMDYDNDGYRDMYITNGYRRDVSNLDYVNFTLDEAMKKGLELHTQQELNDYLKLIPTTKLHNYMYRNKGDLTFDDVSEDWGFGMQTLSNGSAYADLDNDGDMDVISNNILDPIGVYRNKANEISGNNYLQVKFEPYKQNMQSFFSAARITIGDQIQYAEMNPTHGFFSFSEPIIHFGLGKNTKVDKLELRWPDGKIQVMENVNANQRLMIRYADAKPGKWADLPRKSTAFAEDITKQSGAAFVHKENAFSDFDREFLIPHKLSALGPNFATGDVNGDQLTDFYVGGATGSTGALFLQTATGQFKRTSQPAFAADTIYEDMGCVLFDADGDKDLDLFVVSGGNQFVRGASNYENRLYFNDGKGNFTRASGAVPRTGESGSCAVAYDYDKDGDADLFIGGRVVPGQYPTPPNSYVWRNDGGKFQDVTQQVAKEFQQTGMVTAIVFADIDKDGQDEMLATGEWMPISVFKYAGGQFTNKTKDFGLENTTGWWNCLTVADMDGDGDPDLLAGNEGLNTRIKVSEKEPLQIFARDFDGNGAIDPIIAYYNMGKCHPLPQKELITKQIPSLKKKFLHYEPYAKALIQDVYPQEELNKALCLNAKTYHTTYFENQGNGRFVAKALPNEAQMAPVNKILAIDVNHDGIKDIVLAGNKLGAEVETGPEDAGNGLVLLGDGKGNFRHLRNSDSGFWAVWEVRDMAVVTQKNGRQLILVANNNQPMQVYGLK